ncbi:MAG: OmpA family protein [bacterium]|nr:OmpA family protein [bacterium]
MNVRLYKHRIDQWRDCHSVPLNLSILVLLLILGIVPANAQTLFGQSGALSTPSADTYPAGNFSVGSYFRSSCFQPERFDATSVYLITGLSPTTEASFSFPGIWGNKTPPAHFEIPAQISFKQKVYSLPKNRFRFAVEGIMQRRPMGEDSVYDQSANWGLGVIGSSTFGRNTYHLFYSRMVSRGNKKSPQDFAGAGLDRSISEKLVFNSDIYVVSENFFTQRKEITTMMGFRYRVNSYFHAIGGGGVGITKGSNDWQYFLGLSFTTDIKKSIYTTLTETVPPPPPQSDLYEQPGYDIAAGIPPPGSPEIIEAPHKNGNGNGNGNGKKKPPFIFTRLFFDENSFELSEFEQQNLQLISRDINKIGRDQCLTVIGHSDPTGSNQENYAIAMTRALTVAGKIIDSAGLSPESVIIGGAGEVMLSDRRTTSNALQMNRRVELRTCNRLSVQLDTIPEDSCTIRQAIQWRSGSHGIAKGFKQLSVQMANCLTKLGELQPEEFYIISPKWDPQVDYRTTVYRTALFWLYTVQTKQIAPERCFLKLQPELNFAGETEKNAASEVGIDAQLIHVETGSDSATVRIRFTNQQKSVKRSVYIVVTANIDGKQISVVGDTLPEDAIPEYNTGKRYQFKHQIEREFSFPLTTQGSSKPDFQVYFYDANGKTLGTTQALKSEGLSPRWAKRFAEALHLSEKAVEQPSDLEISIRKYRSNDVRDFNTAEK